MPNFPQTPGTLASDDRDRQKRMLQPGETITFQSAFRDARGPLGRPAAKPLTDPKAAMALARRQWCDRKANARRMAEPVTVSTVSDARTALADARAAKLVRVANAYRANR
jgi:hypothetical protein